MHTWQQRSRKPLLSGLGAIVADFLTAVSKVLAHEGGYTAGLPDDPGGETAYGISKTAYPSLDIANLTRDDAIQIYQRDYWQPAFDQIQDQRLANSLLDFCVNAGVSTAVKTLQHLIPGHIAGPLVADGIFGQQTAECLGFCPQDAILKDFTVARLKYYAKIGKQQFFESWFRRTLDY